MIKRTPPPIRQRQIDKGASVRTQGRPDSPLYEHTAPVGGSQQFRVLVGDCGRARPGVGGGLTEGHNGDRLLSKGPAVSRWPSNGEPLAGAIAFPATLGGGFSPTIAQTTSQDIVATRSYFFNDFLTVA